MTRNEIVELAKQAGLLPAAAEGCPKELEAFTRLVEKKEYAATSAWFRGLIAKIVQLPPTATKRRVGRKAS